jgi:hypothetical protein
VEKLLEHQKKHGHVGGHYIISLEDSRIRRKPVVHSDFIVQYNNNNVDNSQRSRNDANNACGDNGDRLFDDVENDDLTYDEAIDDCFDSEDQVAGKRSISDTQVRFSLISAFCFAVKILLQVKHLIFQFQKLF